MKFEIEDLHWADPSTLEFLSVLIDRVPMHHLLMLLTFRPEFTPPWPPQAPILSLQLSRLAQQHIVEMVQRVAGKALPAEIIQQLMSKSDGVPLYIEEMTKNLLESGLLTETNGQLELTSPLPQLAIPSTLQDSFAARLDRLASVCELAQIGSVLGREFSYTLMQAISQLPDDSLQDGLRQLSNAEILYPRGVPPDATYTFKHALLQETAYQSLLKSQRQHFHAQTAQVLEQQFADLTARHPELLAHHHTEAGQTEQALPYWQQAGQYAIQRSAHTEATQHLKRGLDLLQTLPETSKRLQQELFLLTPLGIALTATKGFGDPEVEHVYERAWHLCQQLSDTPQLFPILVGLRGFYTARGELNTSGEIGQQLVHLAQRSQDPELLLEAYSVLGMTSVIVHKSS